MRATESPSSPKIRRSIARASPLAARSFACAQSRLPGTRSSTTLPSETGRSTCPASRAAPRPGNAAAVACKQESSRPGWITKAPASRRTDSEATISPSASLFPPQTRSMQRNRGPNSGPMPSSSR